MRSKRFTFPLILAACVLAGVMASRFFGSPRSSPTASSAPDTAGPDGNSTLALAQSSETAAAVDRAAVGTPGIASASAGAPPTADPDAPAAMNPNFRLRPFRVSRSSATHQWTAEDGLSDAAIRELAHNELEADRYKSENRWTNRRQLVYRNEKVGDFVVQLESGDRNQFTVPGFDGNEFVVNVDTVNRFNDDGFGIHGTIAGYPDSKFELGYARGREAMTIEIPSQGIRYEIHPRENYEVVVNEINVPAYQRYQPKMGEPLRNDDVGAPGTPPRR